MEKDNKKEQDSAEEASFIDVMAHTLEQSPTAAKTEIEDTTDDDKAAAQVTMTQATPETKLDAEPLISKKDWFKFAIQGALIAVTVVAMVVPGLNVAIATCAVVGALSIGTFAWKNRAFNFKWRPWNKEPVYKAKSRFNNKGVPKSLKRRAIKNLSIVAGATAAIVATVGLVAFAPAAPIVALTMGAVGIAICLGTLAYSGFKVFKKWREQQQAAALPTPSPAPKPDTEINTETEILSELLQADNEKVEDLQQVEIASATDTEDSELSESEFIPTPDLSDSESEDDDEEEEDGGQSSSGHANKPGPDQDSEFSEDLTPTDEPEPKL